MAAVFAPDYHDLRERPAPLRLVPPIDHRRRARYRRRRLAATAVLVLTVLATVFVVVPVVRAGVGALVEPLTPPSAPATGRLQPVAQETFIVRPGDTLWAIARRMQPTGDVRPLVDRLAASRHGAALHPGDRLVRP